MFNLKIVNKKKYLEDQELLNKLQFFALNIKELNGVLTGETLSYNEMRKLALKMCQKLYDNGFKAESIEYKQLIENIDKIAWHSSIMADCCIGGYDWLFKDIFFDEDKNRWYTY